VVTSVLELVATAVIAVAVGICIGKRWPGRRRTEESVDRQPARCRDESSAGSPAGDQDTELDSCCQEELPNYRQQVVPLVRPERWRFSENFTPAGRRVISDAHLQAYLHHSDHVGTEHLLIAVIDDCPELVTEVLCESHVTGADVRQHVEAVIGPAMTPRAAHLPYSPHVKRALTVCVREAQREGDQLIDVRHILRGLLCEDGSAAARFLTDLGVDPGRVAPRRPAWSEFRRERNVS
jgi:hypothetical protein